MEVVVLLLRRTELPQGVVVPFAAYEKYARVTDKVRLFRLAKELDVPIPETVLSTDQESAEGMIEAAERSGFPVVVKPAFSKIRTENGWADARVRYAADVKELRKVLSEDVFRRHPFLVQKRIEGPGIGIFLLMKNGEVAARLYLSEATVKWHVRQILRKLGVSNRSEAVARYVRTHAAEP